MLDGPPLHLAHQGYNGNGHIGEQEQREGKGIEDLLLGGGSDLLPLGDGGKDPHQKQHHIQNITMAEITAPLASWKIRRAI